MVIRLALFAGIVALAGGLDTVRVDAHVPVPPTPFAGGIRTHLAYELHITNLHLAEVTVEKLEVIGDAGTLASYEGPALNQVLTWPGDTSVRDWRRLARWQRTIAWIWLALDAGATVPATLRHRLTIDGKVTDLEPLRVAAVPPAAIAPPLRGGTWIAVNGPGRDSAHRLSMMVSQGRLRIPQRFAVDWILAGDDGKVVTGDPADNKSHRAYGEEVIAVADGVVTTLVDGIPDNVPGAPHAVPITEDTLAGNYIVLDIGGGRYAFYAHLQPGRMNVRQGARVRQGQALGRLGNSGDSFGPHLHFHVMDGSVPVRSEGIPFVLSSFEALAGPAAGRRSNASPMQNARVRFDR